MANYNDPEARAAAKGIRTFGDALRTLGVEGGDVWFDGDPEEMEDDYLYDCDAANWLLESLDAGGYL